MLNRKLAETFSQNWINAWNRRDLDTLAAHYTEDFEFTSPFVQDLMGVPDGTLKGIQNVRTYWEMALKGILEKDIHFELKEVYVGCDSLVINYNGVLRKTGCQIFFFNDVGAVYKAISHYDHI
ncbi:MAG: nuclear transport factor 2 family protein [Magnetococcales bacterium]|nr:nuclear transport factor 2 family protein [Magnetococcales bacterium]